MPFEASEETRRDDDSDDVLDSAAPAGNDDDADDGDRASARRTWFASSIGLSVLLLAEVESLEIRGRMPRQALLNVPVTETVSRHPGPGRPPDPTPAFRCPRGSGPGPRR